MADRHRREWSSGKRTLGATLGVVLVLTAACGGSTPDKAQPVTASIVVPTTITEASTTVRPTTTVPTTTTTIERKVPVVSGERLDLAKVHLKDAGYALTDLEVIGGGTFGVVADANWTVCSTEPKAGTVTNKVRLIVARAC